MTKHEKINKILFTIMAVFVIIFVSVVTIQLITEKSHKYPYDDFPDTSIVSGEKARQQIKQNLRENIVSVNSIVAIDSLKSLYYIPISQLRLKKPEVAIETEMYGVAELRVPDYSYYRSTSNYNNILILNLESNTQKVLFDDRVCIIEDELYRYNNNKYLLLILSEDDTNSDNILDQKDLLKIYIYDINMEMLHCITNKPLHIIDLIKPTPFIDALFGIGRQETVHEFFVKIGYDRNSDGYFNPSSEPAVIQRIDLKNYKLSIILDQKVISELQIILDGKNLY